MRYGYYEFCRSSQAGPEGRKNKSDGRLCVKILSKHVQVRARELAFMHEHATEYDYAY